MAKRKIPKSRGSNGGGGKQAIVVEMVLVVVVEVVNWYDCGELSLT